MSIDTMRKQFEDFALRRNAELIAGGHGPNSALMIRTLHYPIWVESRAVLLVELPEGITTQVGPVIKRFEAVAAIEDAGLRVSP